MSERRQSSSNAAQKLAFSKRTLTVGLFGLAAVIPGVDGPSLGSFQDAATTLVLVGVPAAIAAVTAYRTRNHPK